MNYLTASEIIERASEKIIPLNSQKETVQNIAALLSLHLKKLAAMERGMKADFLPNFSELIIAPTGSGKTYLISKLSEAAGLPFFTVDCSMLTLSGYKGINLNEAFRSLKQTCPNSKQFHRSIILFDEFDKCTYRSVESGNVQANFLKLLEGENLSCDDKIIDTSEMLFLFAGAFQGLEDLVQQRCQPKERLGFVAEQSVERKVAEPTMDDVQAYGFNRELLGRIGTVHRIPPMQKEDYRMLLTEGKTSVKERYRVLFEGIGVSFSIDDNVSEELCSLAMKRKMGARGMEAIVREVVLSAVSEIESDQRITEAILTMEQEQIGLQYRYGKRITPYLTEKDPEMDGFSLQRHLRTEKGMNDLAGQWSDLMEEENRELCYYFLQTTLRYLSLETCWDDRTLRSIDIFTEQISSNKVEGKKSVFDILIEDTVPKAETQSDYRVLHHFYHLYKELENECSSRILKHMMKKINQNVRKRS